MITLTVNGERVTRHVEPRRHLIDFLRLDLGLTGSHAGCEHGVCGACSILVDGQMVRGCLVLAASLDGADVTTIEGLTDTGEVADLQEAFVARNAAQCGFCSPGMVMAAAASQWRLGGLVGDVAGRLGVRRDDGEPSQVDCAC